VIAPEAKLRVAAPTARAAPAVTQFTESVVVPEARVHLQVVEVPTKLFIFDESTAAK